MENAGINCSRHSLQISTITSNGNAILVLKFVTQGVRQWIRL
jgi:hypothetical protein